ncbi:hypothetical protein NQZ79_g3919 [Umbelopsis isabellina]|nr:hypothetical protein NQZ79_g3919 [Umbelopsis isabellina]
MSLDVDWSKLDDSLAAKVRDFLNEHFKNITKPSFIGEVEVVGFDWGIEPPQIEITHIGEPFDEFYADDLENEQPVSSETTEEIQENAASYMSASKTESITSHSQWPTDLSENNSNPYFAAGSQIYGSGNNISNPSISISQHELRNGYPVPSTPTFNAYLLNSFHRSPLVAPHHPFSSTPNLFSPTQSAPLSPTLSSTAPRNSGAIPPHSSLYRSDGLNNAGSALDLQDWIDDVEFPRQIGTGSQGALDDALAAAVDESKAKLEQSKTESDFQVHFSITYKGDMAMTILTELRMNYPSVMFMSLPMQLRVTALEFEAVAVVAYLKGMNRICISMLEPENLEADGVPTVTRDFGRFVLFSATSLYRLSQSGLQSIMAYDLHISHNEQFITKCADRICGGR